MVFNWVWKNMLGGTESGVNEDGTTTAEVSESTNSATPVPNSAVEKPSSKKTDVANRGAAKTPKVGDTTLPVVTEVKKNGSANTASRGRKNKLITTESTDAKKMRVAVPGDDAKAAASSSTAEATDPLTSASRQSYPFDEMYARLVAYKEEKGHCRVPQNYKEDRKLAAWVKNIRRNQKPGKVVDEKQIEQLNAIGFQWESKAGRPVGATIEAGAKSPARKFRKPIEDDED